MPNFRLMRPVRRALATSLAAIVAMAAAANHAVADKAVSADDAVLADDGWRRTAHGWERVETLQAVKLGYARRNERFIQVDPSQPPAVRWDFHPAGLALVQVLVVALAMATARLPARSSAAAKRSDGGQNSLGEQRSCDKAA